MLAFAIRGRVRPLIDFASSDREALGLAWRQHVPSIVRRDAVCLRNRFVWVPFCAGLAELGVLQHRSFEASAGVRRIAAVPCETAGFGRADAAAPVGRPFEHRFGALRMFLLCVLAGLLVLMRTQCVVCGGRRCVPQRHGALLHSAGPSRARCCVCISLRCAFDEPQCVCFFADGKGRPLGSCVVKCMHRMGYIDRTAPGNHHW